MKKEIEVQIDVTNQIQNCTLSEIQRNIDKIIKQYGDNCLFIDTEHEYGDTYIKASIFHKRIETDEEYNKRLELDKRVLEQQRIQYEKLKEIFGDG